MWLQLVYGCLPSLSDGETVFAMPASLTSKGIVSKRKDSAYRSGRSPDWLARPAEVAQATART
jgi:hypothetical protein